VELYPLLYCEVLRKPSKGEMKLFHAIRGSHHVLLPYFEISQVSQYKTSITLRLFSNKLCAGRCQLAPISTITITLTITRLRTLTLTLTLTTIEFKWFKWFKEFKSLMKRLHVAKIVIFTIRTKKTYVFLAKK